MVNKIRQWLQNWLCDCAEPEEKTKRKAAPTQAPEPLSRYLKTHASVSNIGYARMERLCRALDRLGVAYDPPACYNTKTGEAYVEYREKAPVGLLDVYQYTADMEGKLWVLYRRLSWSGSRGGELVQLGSVDDILKANETDMPQVRRACADTLLDMYNEYEEYVFSVGVKGRNGGEQNG